MSPARRARPMKLGAVPLAQAEGAILAHAHHLAATVLRNASDTGRLTLDAGFGGSGGRSFLNGAM